MLLESLLIVLCVLLLGLGAGLAWSARELRRLRREVSAQAQDGAAVLSRIEQHLAQWESTESPRIAGASSGSVWTSPPAASADGVTPSPLATTPLAASPAAADWPPMPPVAALPIRDLKPGSSMPLADMVEDGQDSYALARRLASQGADLQQLVQICALSRDEAELMLRLHGPSG